MVHPTTREALPFALLGVLGLVSAALPPYDMESIHLLVAFALLAMLGGWALAVHRRVLPGWAGMVGPLLSFVLIAVLRDATGGSSSGVAPLIVVPVFYVALFGRRRDLVWVAVATVLTYELPVLLIGAPHYLPRDGRKAILWMGVVLLIAPVVQRVVRTEREARLQVVEAEERWRVLMDNLPDVTVMVVDEEHRIELITGAGAIAGQFGDMHGKRIDEVALTQDAAVIDELIDAAMAGASGEALLPTNRSGSEHQLFATALPSPKEGHHALVLARDVSRERAHELALTRAKERSERLFEDSPNGIVLTDGTGLVVRANAALASVFGVSPEALVGTRLSALSAAESDDALLAHLAAVAADSGGHREMEWDGRDSNGYTVHLALSSTALEGDEDDLLTPDDGELPRLVLSNVVDVSERIRHAQELSFMADHDPLTGLANRRRFEVDLSTHLSTCERYGAEGALLLLDLDNFKEVNDTLGHGVGDELIISIAQLLSQGLRVTDHVARLGGDEFAVLLPKADAPAARFVAQDILERVRAFAQSQEGVRRRITASIGVVLIRDRHTTLQDLMATADMTMYDAKEAGRDQYVVLGQEEHEQPRMGARLEWSERIQRAIEHDEFVLQLQPILDVRTGRINSAEALIRLQDGDELLLPQRFLSIAERTGEIIDIDRWVVDRSIALLADVQRTHPDFQLEVNLSGKSIGSPLVESAITASLLRHGADPRGLVLEITETAAVAHMQTALSFAERQRRLGCKFALDDFGAGYGSFYYLKHLPIDYVKIDGEFVAHCATSSTDRTIVGSIVSIARGLGKQTIAEHVSSAEILQVVQDEGVDYAQGFHVGASMSVGALLDTLAGQPV
jgi:diguanylate cyclase (GGDEF)-like protein/PAS domain S-box-containing protein